MHVLEILFALVQWLITPAIGLGVSIAYYQAAEHLTFQKRIAVSAHGGAIAALYVGALGIHLAGLSADSLMKPYWAMFALPTALVAYSLIYFREAGWLHLLQLANSIAIAFTLGVGTMAVTGNWL